MLIALWVFVYVLVGVAFLLMVSEVEEIGPPPTWEAAVFVVLVWPSFVLVWIVRWLLP